MAVVSARAAGVLLAGTGVAHFVAPQIFEPVSAPLFPEDTRQWVYRNGAAELALGVAVAGKRTRKLGAVGFAAYALWLGSRALQRS